MLSTPKSRRNLFLASSLLDGLEDNDLRQVETLLSVNDADPNVLIPNRGVSPFHLVIGDESEAFAEEVTKLFLRHGGDPNVKAADGMTPVHIAAAWGRIQILQLLLANGGDPLAVDEEGRTPFHYALDGAFYEAVALLGKYCGGDHNDEEEEPKFKLTLDKILVNTGNVVAEYVPSKKQKEIAKDTWSSGERSLDSDSLLLTNVTFRRNPKSNEKKKTQEFNLPRKKINPDEEKILVSKIIQRLSNSLTSETTMSDIKIAANCQNVELKKRDNGFAHDRVFAETSIVSKSPNCRLQSIKDKTTKGKFKFDKKNDGNEKTAASKSWKRANFTPKITTRERDCHIKDKLSPKLVENNNHHHLKAKIIDLSRLETREIAKIAVRLENHFDESADAVVEEEEEEEEETLVGEKKDSTPERMTQKREQINNEAESPGSSNPISFYPFCQSYSNEYYDETQIFDEIDKVSELRCQSPPASISMLQNSSQGSLEETLNDPSNESNVTCEFHEAQSNSAFLWSPSDSFLSVDEEYTYEDEEKGVAFIERHLRVLPVVANEEDMNRAREESSWIDRLGELSIASSETSRFSVTSSVIAKSGVVYDQVQLREKLRSLGEAPGPITKSTFNVYLKRLWRLEQHRKRRRDDNSKLKDDAKIDDDDDDVDDDDAKLEGNVPEYLLATDWIEKREFYKNLEDKSFTEYAAANPKRKYRGGISKTSFCYLLLDPRITKDLPRSGANLSLDEKWIQFLHAVFYVGKGKAARPIAHLYDAFGVWCNKKEAVNNKSRKIEKILDIWKSGLGVVCLHVFSHSMNEEACTREAAMIEALGTSHLTNSLQGTYYGYAVTMSSQEKQALGKFLLYKSMQIFMFEGERQLFPRNVVL